LGNKGPVMRIEAIDKIRAKDDDGRDLHMEPGDIRTVGDNFGALACRMGWAKDVEGKVETGQKSRDPVTVLPQNVVAESSTKA